MSEPATGDMLWGLAARAKLRGIKSAMLSRSSAADHGLAGRLSAELGSRWDLDSVPPEVPHAGPDSCLLRTPTPQS